MKYDKEDLQQLQEMVIKVNNLLNSACEAKTKSKTAINVQEYEDLILEHVKQTNEAYDIINDIHQSMYGCNVPEYLDYEIVFQTYIYNVLMTNI